MNSNLYSFSGPLPQLRAVSRLLVLAFLPLTAGAATLIWTNTAGGAWTNAANWSPNQVPSAADQAFITNAGSYTVTLAVNGAATLTLGGSGGSPILQQGAGTLTLGGESRIRAGGNLNWTGGTLAGAVTLESGALLGINGSGGKTWNAAVTNLGTIQFG
ncbi:MAG: hypothetical protein KJ070_01900, partial [Verrucomicrobia bacterium]|nr:hypothetical protein [Verrucomicrobiota bacterium]